MALGVDALLKSLLNALGFDPAEFMQGMQGFVAHVYERLGDFDKRIGAIENSLLSLHEKLDTINHGKATTNVRFFPLPDEYAGHRGNGIDRAPAVDASPDPSPDLAGGAE